MDTDEFFNPGCAGTAGDGCDCGDCEERRHDHGRTKHFVLFASDNKDFLCIPWEVTRQLRNMIAHSEPIKLETPDGHVYSVEFVKFGLITLTTGWRHFVDANHIRQGDPITFVYCGRSTFKVHFKGTSSGHKNSLPSSQQPPNIFRAKPPRDHHVLNEQVVPDPAHVRTSTDFGYTMFPGTCLTKAQEKKVLELADSSMRSEIPLHVAAMNKRNANEDYYVYIPLGLLDNFEEGITATTIQLEAHGNGMVYFVAASKQRDDQIILESELSHFVASLRIQDNDLLVFRSMRKDRLEVFVLDPIGCEKTCFAMGNSSNAREVREDPVEIVDPPQHTVIDLSSDDDEVVEKGTATSRGKQRPLRGYRAEAQKMASTSSRRTKSGHKADKSKKASLEAPMSNKPYISTSGTKLTRRQEEKVEEKVQAIGSEFPVFVKVMNERDVWSPKRLSFSLEYASACRLPLEQTHVILGLEGSNMKWSSRMVAQKHKDVRHISSFWKDLVLLAGMKVGDICLVELADRSSESLTMTVHLIRKL
ncbi:hypothetical protein CFC21_054401 [Triticum aestivum]|uniref:TF-B3 domain-containing protein n=2 Tax=Triticum aestivum TaxID=4565 RepID=A0A3B6I313_WHEAT|nr:B3 domain-containing protein Os03g0620400-like [Triticum aestivum]KAF7045280.1 hypothetical protein CFC21_054401 [Triticum aestivum]